MIRGSSLRVFIVLIVIVAGCGASLYAQVSMVRPGDLDPHLDSLFTSGQFARLEVEALRLLHANREISDSQRLAANIYLGFSWVLVDRPEDAYNAFLEALKLEPGLDLDEVYVPPRLYEAFERARSDFLAGRSETLFPPSGSQPETVYLPHYRLGTSLNYLFPGAGWFASGQPKRGVAWSTLFVGSAGVFTYSLIETLKARQDYLEEVNPFIISERYNDYNFWHKRAYALGFVTAAVYVGAQLDYQFANGVAVEPALLGDPTQPTAGMRISLRR